MRSSWEVVKELVLTLSTWRIVTLEKSKKVRHHQSHRYEAPFQGVERVELRIADLGLAHAL